MAKDSTFFRFVPSGKRYDVRSRRWGSLLGRIEYYTRWRQWVLVPEKASIWSAECLRDIADFLEDLQRARMVAEQLAGTMQQGDS